LGIPGREEPTMVPSIRLERFDLNGQLHVHLETECLAPVDAEVFPAEVPGRIGAAELLLLHGVRHALERTNGERHGLGDAVQREFALNLRGRAVLELGELSLVRSRGELRDIEHSRIGTLQMRMQLLEAEVDRVDVHGDVDRAGLRFEVEHDGALVLVEFAAPHRHATEMIHLETRMGVLGVDFVGHWRGKGGGGNRAGDDAQRQAN